MPKLPVRGLPSTDNSRQLVRLHIGYKGEIKRYNIAKIINNITKDFAYVLVLGHDDNKAIYMPYDIRIALGVPNKDSDLDFSIHKVGLRAKLCWYINSPDPAVHIPAWIAIGGFTLSITGLILGIASVAYF